MLRDATDALAHLDPDRLAAIEQQALACQAAMHTLSEDAAREIAARLRMFSSVVQATGKNLAILRGDRAAAYSPPHRFGAGAPWAH